MNELPGSLIWTFSLIGFLVVMSSLSVTLGFRNLVKYRLRIMYVPVFISSLMFVAAIATGFAMLPSDFQTIPQFGPVHDLVQQTNPLLLTNLNSIEYGVDEIPYGLWRGDQENVGEYNGAFRTIVIELQEEDVEQSLWSVESTYWHELGHHLWYWFLTDDERAVWAGIYDKDYYIWSNEGFPYFPTDYASTSAKEDFAESFSRFVIDYPDKEFKWAYRTQFLDPERELFLKMFLQRIFEEDPDCGVPVVSCVRVEGGVV